MSMFFPSERLDQFQTTIVRTCTELGDSWADKIRRRIAFAQDLVATGSNLERTNKYHKAANKGIVGAEVNFIGVMPLRTQKKVFFLIPRTSRDLLICYVLPVYLIMAANPCVLKAMLTY